MKTFHRLTKDPVVILFPLGLEPAELSEIAENHVGNSSNVAEPDFFGWSLSQIPYNTRSQSRIGFFRPTLEVQLDHFYTKLGIPVEMLQFLLKLLLKQNSCFVPRFLLIVYLL